MAKRLTGEYFDNQELDGKPALVRTDWRVDFDWGEGTFAGGHPVDHFSARWTGLLPVRRLREITSFMSRQTMASEFISTTSELLMTGTAGDTPTAARTLDAGRSYKIKIEYFEEVGSADVHFGVISATEESAATRRRLPHGPMP